MTVLIAIENLLKLYMNIIIVIIIYCFNCMTIIVQFVMPNIQTLNWCMMLYKIGGEDKKSDLCEAWKNGAQSGDFGHTPLFNTFLGLSVILSARYMLT